MQNGCKVKITSIIAYTSVKKTVPIIIETRTFEKIKSTPTGPSDVFSEKRM